MNCKIIITYGTLDEKKKNSETNISRRCADLQLSIELWSQLWPSTVSTLNVEFNSPPNCSYTQRAIDSFALRH